MPSLEHGTSLEMFRDAPELAARLLEHSFHIPIPPHRSTKVTEADLGKLVPIEFEADLVIELNDERGRCAMAIVLEIQLGIDPDKRFSWPVYVAVLRARKRCPVCLLVVAPDLPVAAWAARSIALGPSTGEVTPVVLGASVVPKVRDADEAKREPALAVLSARVHGNGPDGLDVLRPAALAIRSVDRALALKYFMLVYDALSGPMRSALEDFVMHQSSTEEIVLPQFIQDLIARHGRQDMIFKVAARSNVPLTDAERVRVTSCSDLTTLDRWIENAFTAKTSADIFI